MTKTLSIQASALDTKPSDHAAWAALSDEGYTSRKGLLAAAQGLLGQIGSVDLEFSLGRLGPGDLKKISGELQSLTFRASYVDSRFPFVASVLIKAHVQGLTRVPGLCEQHQ
jgi:hypothetical protein